LPPGFRCQARLLGAIREMVPKTRYAPADFALSPADFEVPEQQVQIRQRKFSLGVSGLYPLMSAISR
jgi:hypothetical protein